MKRMMNRTVIQRGSAVILHYTLSLPDGTVVETSSGEEPAVVVIGHGDLLPAVESRLLGMRAGERARFEIPSHEAYGPSVEPQLQVLARDDFPLDMPVKPGMVIGFETPSGEEVPGTIKEVSDQEVIVDFAHPLAGHDLIVEVEIMSVQTPRA